MLTAARFGAALGGAAHQRSELLLFAQDAGTPAASRFLQLCPGLEQPGSGARMVQLQVCGEDQGGSCGGRRPVLPHFVARRPLVGACQRAASPHPPAALPPLATACIACSPA